MGAAARETRTPLTRILSPSAAREKCGQHHTPRGRQRLSHTHRTQEQERLVRAQESSPGRRGAAVVKPCSRACFRHISKGEQWRREGGLCFGQQGRAVEERREGGGRASGQRRNIDSAFHRRRRQQGSLTNVLLRQVRFVRHGVAVEAKKVVARQARQVDEALVILSSMQGTEEHISTTPAFCPAHTSGLSPVCRPLHAFCVRAHAAGLSCDCTDWVCWGWSPLCDATCPANVAGFYLLHWPGLNTTNNAARRWA